MFLSRARCASRPLRSCRRAVSSGNPSDEHRGSINGATHKLRVQGKCYHKLMLIKIAVQFSEILLGCRASAKGQGGDMRWRRDGCRRGLQVGTARAWSRDGDDRQGGSRWWHHSPRAGPRGTPEAEQGGTLL